MNKLDEILASLAAGLAGLVAVPGIGPAAATAAILLKIAQAAVAAHEKVTGEPLDLNKLHELPHV